MIFGVKIDSTASIFFLNDAPRWGASFKKKMDAVEWDFTPKNAKNCNYKKNIFSL